MCIPAALAAMLCKEIIIVVLIIERIINADPHSAQRPAVFDLHYDIETHAEAAVPCLVICIKADGALGVDP